MDYFSLIMDGISILGQGIMHIFFVSRLTGKGRRLWHFAVYCLALCAIQCLSLGLKDDGVISIAAGILGLYTLSRFALGNQRPISWVAAVLAFYVSQLSFGVINSVEAAFFPRFIGTPQLYLLLLAAQAVYFVACIGCYRAVRKLLAWTQDSQTPYIGLLLLPGLFFFGAELYILQTAYSFFVPDLSDRKSVV